MKYAPKIGRAFGQLSEGSKKFGTLDNPKFGYDYFGNDMNTGKTRDLTTKNKDNDGFDGLLFKSG